MHHNMPGVFTTVMPYPLGIQPCTHPSCAHAHTMTGWQATLKHTRNTVRITYLG